VVEETVSDKSILKVIVASGQERPYYLKKYGMSSKGAFIRNGSTSKQRNNAHFS
jgi:ATP-dependent DNA helicase RecG